MDDKRFKFAAAALLCLALGQGAVATELRGALDAGRLGLYGAGEFRLVNGNCADCATPAQALWYFQDELVAVPRHDPVGFERHRRAQDDVAQWSRQRGPRDPDHLPPLVWVGAPQIATGWRIAGDGQAMAAADGSPRPFAVVPKLASNLSYYDARSRQYFADRPLTMRGRFEGQRFVARTLWPEDFALDGARLPLQPLAAGETLTALVRADGGGARAPLAARLLWQRPGTRADQLAGKPVLAFMLNGAQGDDDEAHGGHFAVATGRFGPRGEWGDWLVNNFYGLDSVSEKGIVAATLPMDAYMGDLNSGQSWYRPSYMLVAVLKQERVAAHYQEAIGRVFNHFYRHDFAYRHASANCAGISIETLRTLGWHIPKQGATNLAKAAVALPFMTVKEGSLESGKKAFDYLAAEVTDLYPLVAFTAAGQDLLGRVAAGKVAAEGLEGQLAEDVEAVLYVRIPQFPSSRAFGQAPVASLDEYMSRVPEDRSRWQVVPVPPRPFPPELKDAAAPDDEMPLSSLAVAAYGGFFGVAALGVVRRRGKKRRNRP